jgi:hypothetical protein
MTNLRFRQNSENRDIVQGSAHRLSCTRTLIGADGARLDDHEAWVKSELTALDGDLTAFWNQHRESGQKFAEWRGSAVFAFAPTGPGIADFVQLSLGREIEVLAGPVVDPEYRPFSADDLFEPSWVKREPETDAPVLTGPLYRLQRRGGLVHMRSFLAACQSAEEGVSVHRLMERIEAIDAEVGLPFAWFFLMTHCHWVDPEFGDTIADGLRAGRVRLPDRDAAVLLGWADKRYLF